MKKIYYLFIYLLLSFSFSSYGQEEILGEESKYESSSLFERDSMIDVVENYKKRDKFERKKKKIKKNVFYGYKTKRAYTRSGSGNRMVYELFFVLKKHIDPDKNVSQVYWYDTRVQKIQTKQITEKDKPFALILHGPYKKTLNGNILEEGQFYIGTKHGRWETLDKNNTLIDKVKYYKGWPKDSKFDYWDSETKKKLKEVVPYVHNVLHGRYVRYYQSGNQEIEGQYRDGSKIGVWTEFYDAKGQKKIEYQFNPDSSNPEILKKWSSKGKEIYNKYPERDSKKKTNTTNKKKNSKTKELKQEEINTEPVEDIKPAELEDN